MGNSQKKIAGRTNAAVLNFLSAYYTHENTGLIETLFVVADGHSFIVLITFIVDSTKLVH